MVRGVACDACGGAGKIPETPCAECGGSGRTRRTPHQEVEVPAGIENGQRMRISGAGHAGEPGRPPATSTSRSRVAEDERFQRDGTDLISVVSIPATEAMLGTTVNVPTLDGEREIEVAAGTQPGHEERPARRRPAAARRRAAAATSGSSSRSSSRPTSARSSASWPSGSTRRWSRENLEPRHGEGFFSRVRRAFG